MVFGERRRSSQPEQRRALPADSHALERYRHRLRTAPPDAIEQAHTAAFAQLTHDQRAQVLRELSKELLQVTAP